MLLGTSRRRRGALSISVDVERLSVGREDGEMVVKSRERSPEDYLLSHLQ